MSQLLNTTSGTTGDHKNSAFSFSPRWWSASLGQTKDTDQEQGPKNIFRHFDPFVTCQPGHECGGGTTAQQQQQQLTWHHQYLIRAPQSRHQPTHGSKDVSWAQLGRGYDLSIIVATFLLPMLRMLHLSACAAALWPVNAECCGLVPPSDWVAWPNNCRDHWHNALWVNRWKIFSIENVEGSTTYASLSTSFKEPKTTFEWFEEKDQKNSFVDRSLKCRNIVLVQI